MKPTKNLSVFKVLLNGKALATHDITQSQLFFAMLNKLIDKGKLEANSESKRCKCGVLFQTLLQTGKYPFVHRKSLILLR